MTVLRDRLFLFFGVVLPVVAMVFECSLHYCARHFFDPFPSPGHVLLFSLIPFSNFLAWLTLRRDLSQHYGFMSLISGMALGIGCLYSLMFLPLSGVSALCVLLFGFGLLGLCPMLSLPFSWWNGQRICQLASGKNTYFNAHQVEHIGHLIILVMVIAVELPSTLTRINLASAVNPDSAVPAISWLRAYGSKDVLLRACYERSGRATDILGSLYETAHPVSVGAARNVFYRVTGKPFNSMPIPDGARATLQKSAQIVDPYGLNAGVEDEFDLDTDIAGQEVSGVARGLAATSSTISAKVDADALFADLNWTYGLSSKSRYDREARAKVLLPPGAVVTKAVLTIGSQEHDATIMVREAARAHYQEAVVQHQKDPLLVSVSGLNEVLVQCYPVPPSTPVKISLSMVCPLAMDNEGQASLAFPVFAERNFQLESATNLDITSALPLASACSQLVCRQNAQGSTVMHGVLSPEQSNDLSLVVHADRHSGCHRVFAFDSLAKASGSSVIELVAGRNYYARPAKLFIVVDGSADMTPFLADIVAGLQKLPAAMPVDLTLVGDDMVHLAGDVSLGSPDFRSALQRLSRTKMEGGQDDSKAVSNALVRALQLKNAAVLWIHGTQPAQNNALAMSLSKWSGSAGSGPLLYDQPLVPGPNRLLDDIIDSHSDRFLNAFVSLSRFGSPTDNLLGLAKSWQPITTPAYALRRFEQPVPQAVLQEQQAGPALLSLYANRRIQSILSALEMVANAQTGDEADRLASDYHLVTSISSAVVVHKHPEMKIAGNAPILQGATNGIIALDQGAIDEPTAMPMKAASLGMLGKNRDSKSYDKEQSSAPACVAPLEGREKDSWLGNMKTNRIAGDESGCKRDVALDALRKQETAAPLSQLYSDSCRLQEAPAYPTALPEDLPANFMDILMSQKFREQANMCLAALLAVIAILTWPTYLKHRNLPRRRHPLA